jgi:DNA-binding NarL/FixJ family response regulator
MGNTLLDQSSRTVLLVDDHELIRQGLARAFERAGDFAVVGEACTAEDGERKALALRPGTVVTDVRLPDASGLDLVRALRSRVPDLGLVVLTMYAGDDQLFAAMEAGASAFVPKDAPASEVVAAARQSIASPQSFSSAGLTEAMRRRMQPTSPSLSPRELEVLRLLAEGYGVSRVAQTLYMSESTAKTHISSIYEKLGAANRAQALMRAVRSGLLPETSH